MDTYTVRIAHERVWWLEVEAGSIEQARERGEEQAREGEAHDEFIETAVKRKKEREGDGRPE